MSSSPYLQGNCACGRYTYIINVPVETNSNSAAQVLFDRDLSSDSNQPHREAHTPYVRIPLSWYHSSTHAFFPDETHNSIRRMYQHQSPFQRHHAGESIGTHVFCGFCGTNLTFWHENPPEEKDWIYAHLDTLRPGEGLRDLLDALDSSPDESEEEAPAESDAVTLGNPNVQDQTEQQRPVTIGGSNPRGADWFTNLLQGSHLGNSRMVRHGGVRTELGGARVEWEIVEITSDDLSLRNTGKRKLGDVESAAVNQNLEVAQ